MLTMKKLILIIIAFSATNSFAQTAKKLSKPGVTLFMNNQKSDSSLRVIVVDQEKKINQPLYLINGTVAKGQRNIRPETIEKIDVVKIDTIIDNQRYVGQIHIKTKDEFKPKFISLAELKFKYSSFKDMPVVFTLDGEIINSDEGSYFVDENNLLTIVIDKLQNKGNIEIGLIKLLTKSKKNIDARNQIFLRGEKAIVQR